MYLSSIKKIGLTFVVFNIVMIQTVMADTLFYYSAAVLPSIVANKPVANAGEDQLGIAIGEEAMLDGSASSDPTDDPLTYEWAIKIKPEGSTAVLSSVTDVSPTFIADSVGSYTLMLTVNDGSLRDADSMMITVISLPEPSTLKKTGQTTTYADYDDGDYQIGIPHAYVRDDVNGTVTDNVTGLMWQDDIWAQYTNKSWSEAFTYCSTLSLGIYDDWRFPTLSELNSIVDYGRAEPSIDPVFVNTATYYYWSATTAAADTTHAWYISFSDGSATYNYQDKTYSRRVRCVRP